MYAIVFYADRDDVGTILIEGLAMYEIEDEFSRLEKLYCNAGIDSGGILEVERF